MKELFYLCTKNVRFFNDEINIQNDGAAMGLLLGPVLADIFMAELEKNIIPSLSDKKLWKRYVDDTFAIAKTDAVKNLLPSINCCHDDIQFTMEIKPNNKISGNSLEKISATAFGKVTNGGLWKH